MGHRSGRSAENRDTDAAWLAVGVFFPELLTVLSQLLRQCKLTRCSITNNNHHGVYL
jgi:hypothetical protein